MNISTTSTTTIPTAIPTTFLIYGGEPIQTNIWLESIYTALPFFDYTIKKVLIRNELDWQYVLAEIFAKDLFIKQKVLEIRFISGYNNTQQPYIQEAITKADDVVLIFIIDNLSTKQLSHPWINNLKSSAGLKKASPIPHYKWLEWLKSRLVAHNISVDETTLQALNDSYVGNTVELENTLISIKATYQDRSLAANHKLVVSYLECKPFIQPNANSTTFSLVDAILNKNYTNILHEIHNLQQSQTNILLVLGAIHKAHRCLLELNAVPKNSKAAVKEEITSKYLVPKFKSIKYQQLAKIHSPNSLAYCSLLANEVSLAAKGLSHHNAWHLLTQMILRLAGSNFNVMEENFI